MKETDLVLTSSIFNIFLRTVPSVLFLLFLLSCSISSESKLHKKSPSKKKLSNDKNTSISYGPKIESLLFTDKTEEFGLKNLHAVTFNAVDLNFDGFTDLIVLPTYYSRPNFYIWNNVLKKFETWAHDPLPLDFKASFILFNDLNKDMVPDLIVGVLNQRSEISKTPLKFFSGAMKEGKIYFKENPKAFKLPVEPTSSITLIDYDLDGWLDIFVSNWFENNNNQYIPVADRLLRNNRGIFEDVTSKLIQENVKSSDQLYPPNARPTYGASTCDVDQNGYPDILTISSSGHKNKLWMNLKESKTGERYFEDVGPISNYASDPIGNLIPTGGGRSFFSACTDYNNDGIMDIFLGELSHAYDNDSVDRSSILTGSKENYPPFFIRTEYLSDVTSESWNQGDRRGVWFDYNLDGRVDLLVDNSGFPPFSRLVLFQQDETAAFNNVATQLGIDTVNPIGTVVLDINKDHVPDILTGQNNIRKSEIMPRLYLFKNNTPARDKKIIKIHLHGIYSNTDAIGAMVMLYTERGKQKIVQRRWVEYSQGGLPSQNESGITFGVPKGIKVAGVKVRWPYVKKTGFGAGEVLEKLYPLKSFSHLDRLELTLCEDGKILKGKISCQI